MKPTQWSYLVSETQFATELIVTGLRRLCTVPDPNKWFSSYDQIYPLHVGLHSYTSGLERLCKLTIACHGLVMKGTFPQLKSFGHRIGKLIDRVGNLDLASVPNICNQPMERPKSSLDPELTKLLEQYASGAGRYEHLDSLWSNDTTALTYDTWSTLSSRSSVSKPIMDLVSMRAAVNDAMKTICTHADFEASGFSGLEEMGQPLHERSIGLAMDMYGKASWVASILDAVTYYTCQELPILGEVTVAIRQPPIDFFQYSVAQVRDIEVTLDELKSHFQSYKQFYD